MKKSIVACLVISGLLISQGLLADAWGNGRLFKTTELSLSADVLSKLRAEVAAGDLSIKGVEGLSEIKVTAKIFGDEMEDSDYTLTLDERNGEAVLIAQFNENTYNNERIDLLVTMPKGLALEVEDRSGDISIESVSGGVLIGDRSGDIALQDIAGGIQINDRSGDIEVRNVQGDVNIKDRSGDIRLNRLNGDLTITDSSGDIRVKDASGMVTVEDSSGDININGAADFKLIDDSSGDVTLRNIHGD